MRERGYEEVTIKEAVTLVYFLLGSLYRAGYFPSCGGNRGENPIPDRQRCVCFSPQVGGGGDDKTKTVV